MSDALQPSSTTASGTNVVESSAADAALLECHACGTKQQPIRLCCNCHSVGFCSLMCERTAWDSGHSRVCERPQPQPLLQPRIGSVEAAHAGSSAEELKTMGNQLYSQRLFLQSVAYVALFTLCIFVTLFPGTTAPPLQLTRRILFSSAIARPLGGSWDSEYSHLQVLYVMYPRFVTSPCSDRYAACAADSRECLRLLDCASFSMDLSKETSLRNKIVSRLLKCAVIEGKKELVDGHALDSESAALLEGSVQRPSLPPGLQPQRSLLPFMRCAATFRSRE